MTNPASACQS